VPSAALSTFSAVAPYGYKYIGKHDGDGEARYEIVFEEARVVQQIFDWLEKREYQSEKCASGLMQQE